MSRLVAVALLALGLALAPRSHGQPSDTAAATLPDPVALTAQWWSYFADAGDDLDARVRAFHARLDEVAASLTGDDARAERLRSLVTEAHALSDRFADLSKRTPPPAPPLAPAEEHYALDALLAAAATARDMAFERDFNAEEAERLAASLDAARGRIDDAKAAYLALPSAAPERLESGLELVRGRLLQAINEAELALRRAEVTTLTAAAQHLADTVDAAGERLQGNSQDAEKWLARAERAAEEERRLSTEAAFARLRVGTFSDEPLDRARRRRAEQRVLDYETRIAAAALEERFARLGAQLVAQIARPDDGSLEALRAARTRLRELAETTQRSLAVWRQATERERIAAMAQIAETQGADAALSEVHRSRIDRADETSQQIHQLERLVGQAHTLVGVASAQVLEQSGWFSELSERSFEAVGESWDTVIGLASESLFTINETPVTAAGLLRVAFFLLAAWWLSRLVQHALGRMMERRDGMSRASLYTLGRLLHYVLLVVALVIGMSSVGLDFTKFALLVSALGVGLGFGLQAIFSNFVAGLIILFERSLKVGDFVELESGVYGEVGEINIRSTLVTTNDNIDILIPNSEFVNGRVTNWTLREASRRVRIPFGVAYGTDKELVRKAGLEAAAEVPFTITSVKRRAPQVWLTGFGDSSLDFALVVWLTQDAVKRPSAVDAAYNWALESALARHGIEIPFPQRDLHVRSLLGRRDARATEELAEPSREGTPPGTPVADEGA